MARDINIKTTSTNKKSSKIVTVGYSPSVTRHLRYHDPPSPIQSSQDGWEYSLQAPKQICVPDPLIPDHKILTPLGTTAVCIIT
jgi:hypothetical protein